MDAPGAHGHARAAVEPGLMGVAMEDKAVDSGAEGFVGEWLERERMVQPFGGGGVGGEGLRGDDRPGVEMRSGGHGAAGIKSVMSVWIGPEFAHGNISAGGKLEVIKRAKAVG